MTTRSQMPVTVVVLPGLDGTGHLHGPCLDLIAQHYAVQLITYPSTVLNYSDVNDHICQQLPEGDFILVAESFSGPAAIGIGHARPVGLRGIVYVASFASRPRWVPGMLLGLIKLWPLQLQITAWIAQPLVLGRWGTKALRAALRRSLRAVPKTTLIARINAVRAVDARPALAAIDVPMLYLQAIHDRLVPKRAGDVFPARKPIAGPHFLMQAKPQDCADAICAFVADC